MNLCHYDDYDDGVFRRNVGCVFLVSVFSTILAFVPFSQRLSPSPTTTTTKRQQNIL